MKQKPFKIAYCGIMCALAIIVMFISIIPALVYIMPAIAGIVIWTVAGQVSRKWGWLCYAATAILSLFLVPEKEAMTFFIMFFGYYPILRESLHKIKFKPVQYLLKLAIFNAASVAAFLIVVNVFIDIEMMLDGMEGFGEYAVLAFWGMGNVVFVIYDFALNYIFFAFDNWVKPVLNKKIK